MQGRLYACAPECAVAAVRQRHDQVEEVWIRHVGSGGRPWWEYSARLAGGAAAGETGPRVEGGCGVGRRGVCANADCPLGTATERAWGHTCP